MNQTKKHILQLLLFAGCVAVLLSCKRDADADAGDHVDEEGKVAVEFSMRLGRMDTPAKYRSASALDGWDGAGIMLTMDGPEADVTRATDENEVNFIRVFHFDYPDEDQQRKLIEVVDVAVSEQDKIDVGEYSIKLKLSRNYNSFVYFVANDPDAGRELIVGTSILTDFEDLTYDFAEDMSIMPMVSVYYGPIKGAEQSLYTGPLIRTAAKITVTVNDNTPGDLQLSTMQVQSVPEKGSYYEYFNKNYPMLSAEAGENAAKFRDYDPVSLFAGMPVSWYLSENRRGIADYSDINHQYKKWKETDPSTKEGDGNSYSTRLVLKGLYSSLELGDNSIIITLYLGENETQDFNIKRNYHYNIGVNIGTISEDDNRIELIPISPM